MKLTTSQQARLTTRAIRKALAKQPIADLVNQLPALQEGIKTRWEVAAISAYPKDLPPCQLCAYQIGGDCGNCVIEEISGTGCYATPWILWQSTRLTSKERIREAKLELAFLRRIEKVILELQEATK